MYLLFTYSRIEKLSTRSNEAISNEFNIDSFDGQCPSDFPIHFLHNSYGFIFYLTVSFHLNWLDKLNVWPDNRWNSSEIMLKHRFEHWDAVLNCECPMDLPNELFSVLLCYVFAFVFILLRILEICTVTRQLGPLQYAQNRFVKEEKFE